MVTWDNEIYILVKLYNSGRHLENGLEENASISCLVSWSKKKL